MKTSEELPEVALVLWEQLDGLKLKELPGCAIHVNDDAKGTFDAWGAFPEVVDGKMEMKLNSGTHNQQCIWMFREWYKNYRAGKSTFTAACNKTQLNEIHRLVRTVLTLVSGGNEKLEAGKVVLERGSFFERHHWSALARAFKHGNVVCVKEAHWCFRYGLPSVRGSEKS